MKLAYLDPFSGISGDMFSAAILDAEVVASHVIEEKLSALNLGDARLSLEKVQRGALSGTHLTFETNREHQDPRDYAEIRRIIENSSLEEEEKRRALAMFRSLAEAEARIHDVTVDDVHFHEIGALDSIRDIVSAAVLIEALRVDAWSVSRINLGSGSVETEHGRLPVPAPATLELLQGFPTYSSGMQAELTTPTGAAIIRHLNPGYGLPAARWDSIGYGAGTRDLEGTPNVLRVMVGEALQDESRPQGEEAIVIETDLDDMSPQLLPHVRDRLFEHGAQDVSWHPIHMKKGRVGIRLQVLGPDDPTAVDQLCDIVFRETTTLGLRLYHVGKRRLPREIVDVDTPYGTIGVKVARDVKGVVNVAPEYEDCARIAEEKGVPLKEVMRVAAERAHEQVGER